jgi:hypothetical protein
MLEEHARSTNEVQGRAIKRNCAHPKETYERPLFLPAE